MLDLICYCLRVEKPAIVAAIESGCSTVEDLSARLRVSTGCGGCRPDLEDMLRFYRNEKAQAASPQKTE
ncbi:MAG: (2Fe-2S)-binding protein [Fibrobacteria bacterium]